MYILRVAVLVIAATFLTFSLDGQVLAQQNDKLLGYVNSDDPINHT